MSEQNPSSNLPLFTGTLMGRITDTMGSYRKADGEEGWYDSEKGTRTITKPAPSQLAGGAEQAASGLPVAALLALQTALWQTRGTEFSADNLWRNLSPAMREVVGTHPNALGWILARASKLKQVKRTGRTIPSIRPNARGRQVAVWVWLV